ncbi:hypothetical protein V6N13_019991 [Hibiscus sabdariffa]|uniref:histidine kinase n=1 Tax=Hibiscus sabdariffa TaxID=183260 RepID=A0ABR2ES43_9ROSI
MWKTDEISVKTLIILIYASIVILVIGYAFIVLLTNGVSKERKLRAMLISHPKARRGGEASSNYKSQLLANMCREITIHMAIVMGLFNILICDCHGHLKNEPYTMVTRIRKGSTTLFKLLNNILDMSKDG